MTYKQMSAQVAAWLGLQDITDYDETDLVKDLLFQGTIDLLARTRCVVRCVQLRTTAGVDTYTLDHAILSLVDLQSGSRYRARRDQSSGWPWSTDSCTPKFTLIRSDVLMLDPTPDLEDGTVQVWAVMRPQQMTEDTDSPGAEQFGAIPDEFQDAIVTYALWKASDYTDDASSQQGERYRMLYEGQDGQGGRLAQIRMAVNKRGTAKAPPRKVRLSPVSSHQRWVG